MRRTMLAMAFATGAAAPGGAHAATATLSDLLAGGTLTEADVVFSGFAFSDFSGSGPTFPGDRPVTAEQILLSTASTASTVFLSATIAPPIAIAGEDGSGSEHIFEFELDFTAAVAPPSDRRIVAAGIGEGDLFATGAGVSEVVYAPGGFGAGGERIELFEAPSFDPASQTADLLALGPLASLLMEGVVEGETEDGDTAGLSTFTLSFTLDRELAPPTVVPLPAGGALLFGALAGLAAAARSRRG